MCEKKKTCGGSDGCVRDWVFCFPSRKIWLPRSLKPRSADWLIVGHAVQIQSPQLCGSKPNSAQFISMHMHNIHSTHTHTHTLKAGFTVFKWAVQRRRGSLCLCISARAQLDFFPKNSFCVVFCHMSRFRAGWKRLMRPSHVLIAQLQPSSTVCCFTASSLQKRSNKPFPQQQNWHEKRR